MTITLQNRSGRQFVFHVEHEAACTEKQCHCTRRVVGVQDRDRATGQKTLRAHKRRVPGSVTLNAARTEGDAVSGLPEGVLQVPDVAVAVRAKVLSWRKDEDGVPPHHQAGKIAAVELAAARAEKAKKDEEATKLRRELAVAALTSVAAVKPAESTTPETEGQASEKKAE